MKPNKKRLAEKQATPSNTGVYFASVDSPDQVVFAVTSRRDLQIDRLGMQSSRIAEVAAARRRDPKSDRTVPLGPVGLIATPSEGAAKKLHNVLNQFWDGRGRKDTISLADAELSLTLANKLWGFDTYLAGEVPEPKIRQREGAPAHDVIESMMVENPLKTGATVLEEIMQQAEQPGYIPADLNMSTLLGGLARVPRRREAHEMAAKQFRSIFEHMQIGMPRAMDWLAERVDGRGPDTDIIVKVDAAHRRYGAAVRSMGLAFSSLVEKVLICDVSIRALARQRYGDEGGASRMRVAKEFDTGMDLLATHFGFMGSRSARMAGWMAGDKLPLELPEQA